MNTELEPLRKGFSISIVLLIIYLSIFSLDKRLAIIWLSSTPLVFVALFIYDWYKGEEMFRRGLSIDIYMSIGGPITIIGFFASLWFLLKEIRNEEYEESISKEGNGDTRHDEYKSSRGEETKKKPSQSEKSP